MYRRHSSYDWFMPKRGTEDVAVPVDMAEAIERAEDAEDFAAAREALARIDAGDEPISLAELGLRSRRSGTRSSSGRRAGRASRSAADPGR